MSPPEGAGFRLAVLNPRGRDPEQHFDRPATTGRQAHAPVNFHAYAACTSGSFFRDAQHAVAADMPVLLLLRGDFRESERALNHLQKSGRTVAVSLKETGVHQIAEQLADAARLRRFLQIVHSAQGCIAPTPEAADLYRNIRGADDAVAFIPTPYPLEDRQWGFSRPTGERSGIFIGTREWGVPSRNHAAALFAARQISERTDTHVTVFNMDGRKGERLLAQIGFRPDRLRVGTRSRPYAEYLRIVAEHRIVLQKDASFVPGQVAGDALLCRLPCVGGNGAVDRFGHPQTCGAGRTGAELIELATRLLVDDEFYNEMIRDSQQHASEQLSFARVAEQLESFYEAIASK